MPAVIRVRASGATVRENAIATPFRRLLNRQQRDPGLGRGVVALTDRARQAAPDEVLTTRASTGAPPFACSRQNSIAWRAGEVPLRWTLVTESHSASDMPASMRSFRKPAFSTSVSSPPRCRPPAGSSPGPDPNRRRRQHSPPLLPGRDDLVDDLLAASDVPSEPSRSTPRSFTTTLAPSAAKANACDRVLGRRQ